jgi:hypothetical protein
MNYDRAGNSGTADTSVEEEYEKCRSACGKKTDLKSVLRLLFLAIYSSFNVWHDYL